MVSTARFLSGSRMRHAVKSLPDRFCRTMRPAAYGPPAKPYPVYLAPLISYRFHSLMLHAVWHAVCRIREPCPVYSGLKQDRFSTPEPAPVHRWGTA